MRQENHALELYFSEIRQTPTLSREREQTLSHAAQDGCTDAVNELVEANLAFVARVALEYRNLGLPYEDLLNEGNIGLIEAARRFDGERGTKFITYAFWWIRKAIVRAINDHSRTVRLPQSQYRRYQRRGRPTRGVPVPRHKISLDDRSRERPLSDTLRDERAGIDELMVRRELRNGVGKAVSRLPQKERFVMTQRYGLAGSRSRTLKEVGEMMGVSREWVRQIEERAKSKLRRSLTG